MAQRVVSASQLLALASYANAQGPPGGEYGGHNNPYSNGGDNGNDGGYGGFGSDGFGAPFGINKMITAHAICATLAFGLLFPTGGIMIRLASFRGLWLVHGIFQLLSYVVYLAAFGMGIWMIKSAPSQADLFPQAHPIIGIIAFILLLFQPFLGFIHHFAFKKYSKRVVWSYAHIWLGRIVITLGIINGGLGLQLSTKVGRYAPKQSTIIGYSVAASIIWLIYMASAVYGENKRRKAQYAAVSQAPPPYKQERASHSGDGVQYA